MQVYAATLHLLQVYAATIYLLQVYAATIYVLQVYAATIYVLQVYAATIYVRQVYVGTLQVYVMTMDCSLCSDCILQVWETNGGYDMWWNELLINAGLIQWPLYGKNFPKYYNFGTLGTPLAHELIHAVDEIGMYWCALMCINVYWYVLVCIDVY